MSSAERRNTDEWNAIRGTSSSTPNAISRNSATPTYDTVTAIAEAKAPGRPNRNVPVMMTRTPRKKVVHCGSFA